MDQACDHRFTYLREEQRNEGFDRNPRYVIYDVFFCERCLEYKRVKVREEQPSRVRFGREIVRHY